METIKLSRSVMQMRIIINAFRGSLCREPVGSFIALLYLILLSRYDNRIIGGKQYFNGLAAVPT